MRLSGGEHQCRARSMGGPLLACGRPHVCGVEWRSCGPGSATWGCPLPSCLTSCCCRKLCGLARRTLTPPDGGLRRFLRRTPPLAVGAGTLGAISELALRSAEKGGRCASRWAGRSLLRCGGGCASGSGRLCKGPCQLNPRSTRGSSSCCRSACCMPALELPCSFTQLLHCA